MKRAVNIAGLVALASLLLMVFAGPAVSDESGGVETLQADFHQFLPVYIQKIKQRDADYLARIHPELPKELTDFFMDLTLDMMRHAETEDLLPSVTCKEYGVCTVTWPQPNDSWAAQSFIRHEGEWRWLAE